MPLLPISLPPGLKNTGSAYEAKNRWHDANLIRFRSGRIEPVGGWNKLTTQTALGARVTSMHPWVVASGRKQCAVCTLTDVYIGDPEPSYDYTNSKLQYRVTPGAPFGDGVFPDTTPVGGEFGYGTLASAVQDTFRYGLGYGSLSYSDEDYGDARTPATSTLQPTTWIIDNWGNNLVACHNYSGNIYIWENDLGTRMSILTNAPASNRAIVVTAERHLMALGAGGVQKKVQWSSQEANTTWTATATNTAGSFNLETSGEIVNGKRVRQGVLVWTDIDVHLVSYLGPPYVYGREKLADNCGLIGAHAVGQAGGVTAWMSRSRFWLYDGYVRPLNCEVEKYVFDNINLQYGGLIFAAAINEKNEIWWFYPSSGQTTPDRYVSWNYVDNFWTYGRLARTAWADSGIYASPLGAGGDKHIYQHEQASSGSERVSTVSAITTEAALSTNDRDLALGASDALGSTEFLVYVQSGAIELGDGDQQMHATRVITDTMSGDNGLRFRFYTADTPDASETVLPSSGTYEPESDGYTDVRFTCRQFRVSIEAGFDQDFDTAVNRIEVTPGGSR